MDREGTLRIRLIWVGYLQEVFYGTETFLEVGGFEEDVFYG